MKYFAIRDDDLCFFTQPGEIEALYAPVFGRVPISFACVSHTVPRHGDQVYFSRRAPAGYYSLGHNRPLVNYLRRLVEKGHCDVMVHGYTHEYLEVGGSWQPECIWKPSEQTSTEIAAGRDYLACLFGAQPKVFVPPGNSIGPAGILAITAAGLNLSAILTLRPNRPWSQSYAGCYCRRWAYSCLHRRPYPYPLDFGTHRELVAYPLRKPGEYSKVLMHLHACAELRAPFVVATRYWQLADDPYLRTALLNLIDTALDLGYSPATVAEAIAGRRYPPVIPGRLQAMAAH